MHSCSFLSFVSWGCCMDVSQAHEHVLSHVLVGDNLSSFSGLNCTRTYSRLSNYFTMFDIMHSCSFPSFVSWGCCMDVSQAREHVLSHVLVEDNLSSFSGLNCTRTYFRLSHYFTVFDIVHSCSFPSFVSWGCCMDVSQAREHVLSHVLGRGQFE